MTRACKTIKSLNELWDLIINNASGDSWNTVRSRFQASSCSQVGCNLLFWTEVEIPQWSLQVVASEYISTMSLLRRKLWELARFLISCKAFVVCMYLGYFVANVQVLKSEMQYQDFHGCLISLTCFCSLVAFNKGNSYNFYEDKEASFVYKSPHPVCHIKGHLVSA